MIILPCQSMGAFSFRSVSVFILLFFCACIVQSRRVVKYLPGYNGPLPFYLETGYVTVDEVNGGKLFYYFIESEGNPSKDPVVVWLTGGPRCSVLSAILFEIGPIKIVKVPYNGSVPELEYHPYGWTKHASIIFLDSPLGAGFSYSSNPKGYEVGDTSSSLQVHKFLMQWFTDHPNYLAHPFYVGGDSYAGKFIPFVAQLVSEGTEAGKQIPLNLKGYLVGNPVTGEKVDGNLRVPYAHGVGIISDQLFQLTQKNCIGEEYDHPSTVACAEVMDVVEDLMSQVWQGHILEPIHCTFASPATTKDVIKSRRFLKDDHNYFQLSSKPAEPAFHCLSYSWYLSYFWANNNATREALGIEKGTKEEWQRCPADFPYERDIKSSMKYHRNLTSRGYRALVYSGDHDLTIPFLGTQTWVRSLNFPVVDAWRAWHVDGQTAGFTETYSNNITFATVRNGGHTAPEFRPVECFAMFKRWISNQPL